MVIMRIRQFMAREYRMAIIKNLRAEIKRIAWQRDKAIERANEIQETLAIKIKEDNA